MNINRVILTGNLTREPELRATPSGSSVCDLGLAVNERTKVGGEWTDRVNFFNVVVFGKTAENCAMYLSKGSAIALDGRLRYESWEKDGQKRSTVKVVADTVQFLGARDGATTTKPDAFDEAKAFVDDDSDVPF